MSSVVRDAENPFAAHTMSSSSYTSVESFLHLFSSAKTTEEFIIVNANRQYIKHTILQVHQGIKALSI